MGATGMRRFGPLAIVFTLVACADNTHRPPAPAPAPAPSATYGPAPSAATPPPAPEPHASADQCGLDELRGMVGKSRTEIPIPVEPGRRRVVCDTCPMTREFIAGRQTVLFDAKTGLVTSVSCG